MLVAAVVAAVVLVDVVAMLIASTVCQNREIKDYKLQLKELGEVIYRLRAEKDELQEKYDTMTNWWKEAREACAAAVDYSDALKLSVEKEITTALNKALKGEQS